MTTPKAAKKRKTKARKAADSKASGPAANIGGGGGVPTRPRKPPASS